MTIFISSLPPSNRSSSFVKTRPMVVAQDEDRRGQQNWLL
eukprot:CAMPEP_0168433182 /NCGR_PEP_ID=MMETSP0228-20121227/39267_1 /TAXON_ID=133427 /ORGANISM="Protoceratium reticulatum, Strain CCCM 535 (=CCMP 1889)" /LENGTH=39 /DNA_ID= /DNA_START= /DNA_END= /DNA_ORIENTATION=